MSKNRLHRHLAILSAALALLVTLTPVSSGQVPCGDGGCNRCDTGCNRCDCPPAYKYCAEGPPKICIKVGCGKPVCCPADAPNWGYFQTCWRPWPWPPDWSHCYGNPPASQIVPPLSGATILPEAAPGPMPKVITPGVRPGPGM